MHKVELEFEFGHCNGTMLLDIVVDDQLVNSIALLDNSVYNQQLMIKWPATMKIILTGKDLSKDTKIDAAGNIIANKYAKLIGLKVNGLKLNESALYQAVSFIPEIGEQRNDVFWDRNGQVNIEFNQANPLRWNLMLNNLLYFRNN